MEVKIDNSVFPPRKHFVDVDDKFTKFTPKCRVIPANYFHEPNTVFFLKARYEPGENKYFPNGGFEIKHIEGGTYNYYLDEVIVHPFELGMRKFFTKVEGAVKEKVTTGTPGKRGRPRKEGALKEKVVYVPTGKPRGRKALDPAIKAARALEAAEKAKRSGGRRGRPAKIK